MLWTIRLLSIDTHYDLVSLGFALTVLAMFLLGFWVYRNSNGPQQLRATRVLLLSPFVAVLATQLGFYDPVTVIAWALVLTSLTIRLPGLPLVAGLFLGVQHFEQAIFGLAALWLTLRALQTMNDHARTMHLHWQIIVGLIVGKLVVSLSAVFAGHTLSGRSSWISEYFVDWSKVSLATFPFLVWSLFAGLWILVIAAWLRWTEVRGLLTSALVVGVLAMVLSGDRPRVFVIVALPSLALIIATYFRGREKTTIDSLIEASAWIAPPAILFGLSVINVDVFTQNVPTILHLVGLG